MIDGINEACNACRNLTKYSSATDALTDARNRRVHLKKMWEHAAAEVSCTLLDIEFVIAELEDRAREEKRKE